MVQQSYPEVREVSDLALVISRSATSLKSLANSNSFLTSRGTSGICLGRTWWMPAKAYENYLTEYRYSIFRSRPMDKCLYLRRTLCDHNSRSSMFAVIIRVELMRVILEPSGRKCKLNHVRSIEFDLNLWTTVFCYILTLLFHIQS